MSGAADFNDPPVQTADVRAAPEDWCRFAYVREPRG
jgi:hypothetical protein